MNLEQSIETTAIVLCCEHEGIYKVTMQKTKFEEQFELNVFFDD